MWKCTFHMWNSEFLRMKFEVCGFTLKMCKLCKQVVTRSLSNRYQDVFALLVPSCNLLRQVWNSCFHLVKRLTDGNRLATSRSNKTSSNTSCSTSRYELVALLPSTCYVQTISDLLEQLVASLLASSTLLQDDNNLFQTCQQLGTSSANASCW
jgi:hypothetical protein